jgi:hypothetical protein
VTETAQWVSPAGITYPLDGTDGLKVLIAPNGRFAPPSRLVEDKVPLQPGSLLRNLSDDPRTLTWPALFRAATPAALRTAQRAWATRMDWTEGTGTLRVTGPGGDTRELHCAVLDGLDLDESIANHVGAWCKTVLTFHAAWPYWQDANEQSLTWDIGEPTPFFPIFPLHLTEGEVFSSQTITNVGDVDAFPQWSVFGPCTGVVLTNVTTGRVLAWSGTLSGQESVSIDTRPPGLAASAAGKVLRQDGTNAFSGLSAHDLWPLVPGANTVTVALIGATSDAAVTARWRANYRTV